MRLKSNIPPRFLERRLYQDGKCTYQTVFGIKDVPTRIVLERHGNSLLASLGQDDGETWKQFEAVDIQFLPSE